MDAFCTKPNCKSRALVIRVASLTIALLMPYSSSGQQNVRARQFDRFADQQTADSIKALSPKAQTAIAFLHSLMVPAADRWRIAAGEVPNAESPEFDDSAWSTVNASNHRPEGAITLRQWVEVPKILNGYSLTGSTIWMRLDIRAWGSASGVTLFVNGHQVGQSDGVEPIVIRNFMQPGDKVLMVVKCGKSETEKNINPVELHVQSAPGRPDPGDLYTEYATAAVLFPSISDSAIRDAIERSTEEIDQQALTTGDQKRFDTSLVRAQGTLETIRPALQQVTLHVTGDSHMDTAWMWPWTETVDAMKRTFGTALQMMDDHPGYTFSQSVGQYYEWISEKAPAINAGIKKRIDDGRWELVGGMWAEPDLNMPDGESLVRQLLIGQRTMQQLYGRTTRVGWNPDSFGYNWQLPQIYKKSGIDYFVTQKLSANETNPLPLKLFWWESPDGSKVLAYFPHGYANNNLNVLRLTNDLRKARTLSLDLPELMDLYGVGDHGGGPTRAVLDEGLHWMQPDKIVPHMEFGTAQAYFSKVETLVDPNSPTWNYHFMGAAAIPLPTPAPGKIMIPTWRDELYFEHHRGTYTTQATQKRNGRESEESMLNAEKYASLAWLDGADYPGKVLTEAWKKVLINQSHDLSAGSGIAIIYKDAQRDYSNVRLATNEVSSNALRVIGAGIDTRMNGGVPVMVFNPLGWERSGVVQFEVQMPSKPVGGISVLDSNSRVLPSEILKTDARTNTLTLLVEVGSVPSLGYRMLSVAQGSRTFISDLKTTATTLENSQLRVVVDSKNGCITSLYDKRAKFETLAPGACGNELQTFKDTPQNDDAWNIDPGTLDHATPISAADSVQLIHHSAMRATIRVSRTWQNSKFVQDITLDAGSDQLEIGNDIDWHESHVLLKAAFPLTASSGMATYEIPYGTIDRPTTRNNSWDEAKFEVPALRWADLGDGKHGVSLLNEAKYGYDCKDNVLRLTLLRSPKWPDPDADMGHQHFTFALYPHNGDWKTAFTVRRGYEYNYRLAATQVAAHTGTLPKVHSFIQVDGDHVVLTAVKKAEDSDGLILRLYEWAGKDEVVRIHVPKGVTSATLTNLMEKPEGVALTIKDGHDITVESHPFSIETLRVDYPDDSRLKQ